MHRHGYKGRKFGRETDQRRALRRSLMHALITNLAITTTLAKAKEIRRDTEKLVTIAKKGGLQNRRLLISRLDNIKTADLLMDVIAPQITRDSGYLRIERAGFRKGDNTEMATISFVDNIDLDKFKTAEKPAEKKADKPAKAPTKKPAAKKEDK